MARFFSVRVAPGVRLSAGSRGLRAHVGPRGARLHVGGGRTGVSTGVGPFTWYESVGGGRRRPSSTRTPARASSAASASATVEARFRELSQMHRRPLAPPVVPSAPTVELPRFAVLVATAEKQELRGVRLWDRVGRREARQRARVVAEGWARDLLAIVDGERRERERGAAERQQGLAGNDPYVVRQEVRDAAARCRLPIEVTGMDRDLAHLTVTAPRPDAIPERKPARTPAGNPTLAKLTKTEANEWYARLLAGHAILAARLAFDAAPRLGTVAVVVRNPERAALLAVRLTRSAATSSAAVSDAWQALQQYGSELRHVVKGRTRELQPLELAGDRLYS